MDLDARPYRAFVAVADTGSFSRAAALLHVSQPALSAQIKEFERRLGFALFSRTSRSVTLTPEGRLFIDRARRLVTETEWAANAAREIRTNQLRIGAAHYCGDIAERNALIDGFLRDAPDVPIRVMRRSPTQLGDDLERGDIDVAILLDTVRQPGDDADLRGATYWTIAERPLRLWVPAAHPLAGAPTIAPEALRDVPVGMIDRSHGVAVAEMVGRVLLGSRAILRSLPEGDARSVARQCALLGLCAIDLGWFGAPDDTVRSLAVEGWSARTRLIALAKPGERRDGARRFMERLTAP